MSEQLPSDFVCKDKFLVQIVPMNSSESDTNAVNMAFEAVDKADLVEKKLKVVYLADSTAEDAGSFAQDPSPPSSSKPSLLPTRSSLMSPPEPATAEDKHKAESKPSEDQAQDQRTRLKNAEQMCQEYKKKYEMAKDQIQSLEKMQRQMIDSQAFSGTSKVEVLRTAPGTEGFPPILVGLIALFAFLLGLLF